MELWAGNSTWLRYSRKNTGFSNPFSRGNARGKIRMVLIDTDIFHTFIVDSVGKIEIH